MNEKAYINIEKSGGHYLVQFNATDTPIVAETLLDVGGIIGKYISEQFGEKGQATSKQKVSFLNGLLTSGKFPAWETEIQEKLTVEVSMLKRLSRRELTARIQELESQVSRIQERLSRPVEEFASQQHFKAIVDFLGVEITYQPFEFIVRRKQSARATKEQTKTKT